MKLVEHTTEEVIHLLPERYKSDVGTQEFIKKAWTFACKAHAGQQRRSGDPHTEHLFRTAETLSKLGMCPVTIVAAILHDTVEDTDTTEEDLVKSFGEETALLVRGVTKLKNKIGTQKENSFKTLQHLFLIASKDPRVLIIKLADRLHNMQTLGYMSPTKRLRISNETLEIYVPTADRLGINIIKQELEDLSFKYIHPKDYAKTVLFFSKQIKDSEDGVSEAANTLSKVLTSKFSNNIRVQIHTKGLYSFNQKLKRRNIDSYTINDILNIQVIVNTIPDCYVALGYIHALWQPIPGKMHDYISFPKPNGYKALRTTVRTKSFGEIEIRIFSQELYERAMYGYVFNFAHSDTPATFNKKQRYSISSIIDDVYNLFLRKQHKVI